MILVSALIGLGIWLHITMSRLEFWIMQNQLKHKTINNLTARLQELGDMNAVCFRKEK